MRRRYSSHISASPGAEASVKAARFCAPRSGRSALTDAVEEGTSPRVTFTPERKFTVGGREISVKYGVRGANSFYALFNGMKIDGTCKVWLYQIDGALKHVQPGTPIADLFKTVCYKDAAALQ